MRNQKSTYTIITDNEKVEVNLKALNTLLKESTIIISDQPQTIIKLKSDIFIELQTTEWIKYKINLRESNLNNLLD